MYAATVPIVELQESIVNVKGMRVEVVTVVAVELRN